MPPNKNNKSKHLFANKQQQIILKLVYIILTSHQT